METFAEKVKYGGGTRFDPMMEEQGGGIAGDAPKPDEEMPDAEIAVIAEVSTQRSTTNLNPFNEQSEEILPSNVERNYCGFLMRKDAIPYKVNSQKLNERIAVLKDQLLIAKFVGPKPPMNDLKLWIQALNKEL